MQKVLYSGLAGSGKTTKLIEHYLLLDSGIETNGYFLVPTAEQAERVKGLLLEKRNPLINPKITTLSNFAQEISGLKPIGNLEKQLILRELCPKLSLSYFKESLHYHIFYQELSALISELKNYLIEPAVFLEIAEASPKNLEIAQIYEAYQRELADRGLKDSEDCLTAILCNQLSLDFILLDGFADFTPLQEEALSHLLTQSHTLFATTLTIDKERPLLFDNQLNTLAFWQKLGLTEVELPENHRSQGEALEHLNNCFLHKLAKRSENNAAITLLSADNRIMEIELIARELLKVKRQNPTKQWSDFAIIFRQIGSYQELINDTFRFFDIPVTIHEGIYLHRNKLIAWLLQVFELEQVNYHHETLFELLKSAYCSANKEAVRQLEQRAKKQQQVEGLTQWQELLKADPALLSHLNLLAEYSRRLNSGTTFGEILKIYEELITKLELLELLREDTAHVELRNNVRESIQAYNKFTRTLEEIAAYSAESIYETLQEILTQQRATVKEKPANQVQVYDALISRQKEFDILFVANLTMGNFPTVIRETMLLRDWERERFIKREFRLRKSSNKILNETNLFYQAITRGREKLFLSFAKSESSGKKLNASHLVTEVSNCFAQPLNHIEKSFGDIVPGLDEALSKKDLENSIIYNLFQNYSPAEIELLLKSRRDLDFIKIVLDLKNDPIKLREFRESALAELQQLQKFKVTGLELYSRCGFAFFCENILSVRGEIDTYYYINIGKIIHETLEVYYQREGEQALAEIFSELFTEERLSTMLSELHPKQLSLEKERLLNVLENFIAYDEELTNQRNLKIIETEKAIEYTLAGSTITGVIDRVESNGEQILISDYKSGSLPSIGLADLAKGVLPQAWIYALIYSKLQPLPIIGTEYIQISSCSRKGIYQEELKKELLVRGYQNLTADKFKEALQSSHELLASYLQDIRQGKFYTNREQCHEYCTYKYLCRMRRVKANG